MMAGSVTFFWNELSDAELSMLEEELPPDAALTRVTLAGLAGSVLPALARGAVIFVAKSDGEASKALGMGVDEVVRSGKLTPAKIQQTTVRARVRADARAVREASSAHVIGDEEDLAFALLAGAIGHQLNNPLHVATLSCETLHEGLGAMLVANEKLAGWAMLSAPAEECRRLAESRAAAPSSKDIQEAMGDLRQSLDQAGAVVRSLQELARGDERLGTVSVAEVCTKISDLIRTDVGRWAELRTETVGACVARVSRAPLIYMVGALIAHAVEAIRAAERAGGRIQLRASEHDDAVLIELEHNGSAIPADLRPNMFDSYFRRTAEPRSPIGLDGVRERVRRLGGEFLVLSEEGTTTFRLILPMPEGALANPSLEMANAPFTRAVKR